MADSVFGALDNAEWVVGDVAQARTRRARGNPNQFSAWWKAVVAAGAPAPATEVISLPLSAQDRLMAMLEGEGAITGEARDQVEEAVRAIASFAEVHGGRCFLRTGTTSMKHQWRRTCCVADGRLSSVRQHLAGLLLEATWVMAPESEELVVRELIEPRAEFSAFQGLPIGREFRFFGSAERISGYQFYWPQDAIQDPSVSDWRARLAALARISEAERNLLMRRALSVLSHCDGAWSVDFLQAADGRWYLIDMARAEESYKSPEAKWFS